MGASLVLLFGAAAAVVRLVNPPEIVVKDGLLLPCSVNNVCVPNAGMLANHVAVIIFVTLAVAWAVHRVERSSRSEGRHESVNGTHEPDA